MKVRFGLADTARCLEQLHRFYFEHPGESPEADALLSHILDCNSRGEDVRVTDLVRLRRYGTLPTLTARLGKLMERGLIVQMTADDRRVRLLQVTKEGIALLERRASALGLPDGANDNTPTY